MVPPGGAMVKSAIGVLCVAAGTGVLQAAASKRDRAAGSGSELLAPLLARLAALIVPALMPTPPVVLLAVFVSDKVPVLSFDDRGLCPREARHLQPSR